jgi:hypothetical protein
VDFNKKFWDIKEQKHSLSSKSNIYNHLIELVFGFQVVSTVCSGRTEGTQEENGNGH